MAVGYIQTSDQAKKFLQDMRNATGSRSFGSLYAANELAGMKAEQQVEQQYGEQIGQAYKSAMAQRSNILSSNLGTGYKEAMLGDTDQYLTKAYDQYMSNLSESRQAVASSVSKANEAVTSELEKQAANVLEYNKAAPKYADYYMNWLKTNLSEEEYLETINRPDWRNYMTADFGDDAETQARYHELATLEEASTLSPEQEAELKQLRASYYRLKSEEELATPAYNEEVDPETGEKFKHWTSIVDDQGNLTEAGINYYDFLENYAATRQGAGPSWEQYLSETNPELLDWAKTYNPYLAGTNDPFWAGTMRTAHGTMSDDYKYTFLERFGGLGQKEVNTVFGDLKTLADKSIDDINVNDVKDFAAKYRKLAEQTGLEGVDWEAVDKEIDIKLQNIDDIAKEISTKNAVAAGAGIALALVVVGIVASAIVTGGASLAGALTASYAAGSLVSASVATANEVKALEGNKKAQEDALKQMYLNSLTSMVSEVNAKKREQQIREYQSQR
nr:MAG TPA: hypothetical protein [Caudoviricetes sp.]